MGLIALDPDQPLSVGDKVELHFRSTGLAWIRATQIAILEHRLQNQNGFYLLFIRTSVEDPTTLVITVKVTKTNPILVTVAYIAKVIIGTVFLGGIVYKLTFEKSYLKTVEAASSPGFQAALQGGAVALPIIAVVLLVGLFKK